MSLAFPSSPNPNETVTIANVSWTYTSKGWKRTGSGNSFKTVNGKPLTGTGELGLVSSDIPDFATAADARIAAAIKAPIPVTASITLTSAVHAGHQIVFNGADATLAIGTDASGGWSGSDTVTVYTTTGSTGQPTVTTTDGKSLKGTQTFPIQAVRKGVNSWELYALSSEQNTVHVGPLLKDAVSAFSNIKAGQTISLYPNALYEPDSNSTNILKSTKGFSLQGNGATVKPTAAAWAGSYAAIDAQNKIYTSSVLTTSFTVTEGSNAIALPAEISVTLQPGDVITFYSDVVKLAVGGYNHGFISRVIVASGQNVFVDAPPYATMTINQIEVRRIGSIKIRDVIIDMSQVPAGLTYFSAGIQIQGGHGHEVSGVQIIGNDYAQMGINLVHSHSALVTNCYIRNLWNQDGISGGGRLGYGVNIAGNNVTVTGNTFYDCKHSVASGPRAYNVGGIHVQGNFIYEDPAKYATSVGGSIDCHAGAFDVPHFEDNHIWCLKQAFNVRCGQGHIRGNQVRYLPTSAFTGGVVRVESEIPPFNLLFEDNEVYGVADIHNPVIARSWGVAESFQNVRILGNRLKNIDLASITTSASFNDLTINDNECAFTGTVGSSVLGIYLSDINLTVSKLIVKNNKITTNTASTGIFLTATTFSQYKTSSFVDSEIVDNKIFNTQSVTAVTGISALGIKFSDTKINGNRIKNALSGSGIVLAGCSTDNSEINGNRITQGTVFIKNASATTASADTHNDLVIQDNKITSTSGGIFLQDTVDNLVFVRSSIRDNKVWCNASVRALSISNRSTSTAWAASTQLDVVNNTFSSTSGVGSIQIAATSTGHKVQFTGNRLTAPMEDLSNTYYGTFLGNTLLSGVQVWKGSTTVSGVITTVTTVRAPDGSLKAAVAPTAGTWAAGEIVWNSAPTDAVGVAAGFMNVVAGIPGTWRSFGVTI
jgi:hypothetical protein